MRSIFAAVIAVILSLSVSQAPAVAGLARVSAIDQRPECTAGAAEIAAGTRQPRRIALTIGNNSAKSGQLKNAVNDARLIASSLKDLGWTVREATEVDRAQFLRALVDFAQEVRKLCPDDLVLFYFSGYGFEVNGISYLTTTETDWSNLGAGKKITVAEETAFLTRMIGAAEVFRSVEAHSGPKVVIFDTCRDDPLAALREAQPGQQNPLRIPRNTLLAYSSESGELSQDEGPNPLFGPYAWSLSQAFKDQNVPAEEIFRRVRREVVSFSAHRNFMQSPFVSSTLTTEVYFAGLPQKRSVAKIEVAPAPGRDAIKSADVDQRRIALVIANDQYGELSALANPATDGEKIAATLEGLGFKVTLRRNLTLSLVNKALRDFGDEAESADWALIYFAGHGMELGGRTFLLPTDVELKQDKHADEEAVLLDKLIDKVEGARHLGLIVLDACRNNPFLKTMKRTNRMEIAGLGRSRSGAKEAVGLGAVQLDKAGVLVAYSARHGTEAFDGEPGQLSPFAQSFVDEMSRPGVEVQMVFRRVRDKVMEATGQRQEPFSYGSLPGREYFFKR